MRRSFLCWRARIRKFRKRGKFSASRLGVCVCLNRTDEPLCALHHQHTQMLLTCSSYRLPSFDFTNICPRTLPATMLCTVFACIIRERYCTSLYGTEQRHANSTPHTNGTSCTYLHIVCPIHAAQRRIGVSKNLRRAIAPNFLSIKKFIRTIFPHSSVECW